MKKNAVFFLAILLSVTLLLTACSSDSKKDNGGSEKKGNNTEETINTEGNNSETSEVTMWIHPYLGANRATENEQMFKDFGDQFTEETGVKANIQLIPWANRDQRMLMAFSAGKGPDIVYLITDHLAQFGTMGVLEPLDSYIPEDVKSDYNESALQSTTLDGKIYAIPMLQTVNPFIYNIDLLEQVGWDTNNLPETWEDLEMLFEKVKAAGKIGFLYFGGENANLSFYTWMWQAGGNVLDDDGNVVVNSPETQKALDKIAEWYKKGYMAKDSVTLVGGNQIDPIWESGDCALMVGGSMDYITGAKKTKFKIDLGMPTKDKEQAIFGTVGGWSVATTSKNKDAAAKLILKVTEKENMKVFLEKSGFLPPKKSLVNMYDNDPLLSKLVQNTVYVRPGIRHPAGRTITTAIMPPVWQSVMLGEDTVEGALKKVVEPISKAVADSMSIKPE